MKKATLFFGVMMLTIFADADQLKIESSIPVNGTLNENERIKIVLTLDQQADAASIEMQDYLKRPAYLNGSRKIELMPSSDRKTFQKELAVSNFYSPTLVSGRVLYRESIFFIPVIKKGQDEIRLKAEKMPWGFKPDSVVMTAGALVADGKFGKALTFDGKTAMASVNRTKFNPEKGTVEAWVFLPLLINDKEQTVFFIQSADIPPWSYQMLMIQPGSRKLKYMIYGGNKQVKPIREIISQEITDENWVYVAITYDLAAKKMELFVNGKSQGQGAYDFPAGGKISDVYIGSRIHNKGTDYDIMFSCQMMIDELRISDEVRPENSVPEKEFTADANTLLLLHFDDNGIFKNDAGK